ncbi:SAM-dependent methyltransferase [Sphingomonas oleivorans]|uniref:SAM-dependent methyltransferase n=1 Tax=Sphingomonas oleivorans TaxID=1735121 RepID=A0A2T5G2W0_9SPHN|nr:cyclopropane-fatty-acyl-phospholipid synthase family protein [Sphingomonas oleivorans]PTQ13451.1 SAM-dependent methyltransferase [Sphingomonas oleivorans]
MWLLDRMLRRIVRKGELTVIEASGKSHRYGAPDPDRAPVVIRFADAAAPNYIARNPRLGIGEVWMDGRVAIEQGDILALISLIRSNAPWERGGDGLRGSTLKSTLGKLSGKIDRLNWERRSKRNVAHHYDLSDRLYDLFLDADRQYSCAYFTDPANGLEQAQADKKAHIAAKLALKPGQRVLDIGCGWGGMALYLNRVADVDVLGITLSEEQLKVARRRAEEAGVADRVKFELIDYRQLQGRFDRIVSVGMFEHVGPPHYRRFFAKCRSLLAEDGVMLLHTIGRMGKPGVTDAFTAKYIFPGGYNPALSEIVAASEPSKLIAADIETLRLHYAYTLQHWYDRTVAAREAIEALYDARFYRLWIFYLAGALSAFAHGGLCNYQIQYIRRRDTLPITRDYMSEAEAAFRARG